ncbi:MAG: VCBS repeat-containing protein [Oscillospiraceae bacterium]|nr:VCBS repeat-containing protein [Oscillospiraceae bacterium]
MFAVISLLLTGCGGAVGDDLLRLPKPPKDFLKLQEKIDTLISAGGEYSPPASGNNRQVQQTIDLTGNGVSEALVFMRFPGERPLRIYIYRLAGDDYQEMGVISGDADNIDSIHYSDLDGDGLPEILVGWEVGGGTLKTLTVYKLTDGRVDEALATNYTELSVLDIRASGQSDLVVLRHDESSFTGTAQLYFFEDGEVSSYPPASFSKGAQSFLRIRPGFLSDGHPALYVASKLEQNAIITDIFTVRGSSFFNVSLNPESEISDETIRNVHIYATDLDMDGVIELPRAYPLPGYENSPTDFWYIEWRNYDAYGRVTHVMTTYHSHTDGWYIRLPERWIGRFTVSARSAGGYLNATTLAYINDLGGTEDVCVIYRVTGGSRDEPEEDRFRLGVKTDAVYSARLLPGGAFDISEEELAEMFNLIGYNWITGEIEE